MAKTEARPRAGTRAARELRAREAAAHLTRASEKLASVITKVGEHRLIVTRDPFVALVGSIVHQQISMSAAKAIHRRLVEACPARRVTPEHLLSIRAPALRKCGLSKQKIAYLRDLSGYFERGELTAARLRRMPDEEVIEATTAIKGIGRWTAEMLLIFSLERPDVWPIDDLGIRKACQRFLGSVDVPDRKTLTEMAEPWRPYRSYASWYLWRSLEGPLMPGLAL